MPNPEQGGESHADTATLNPNIQRFEKEAALWDENPARAELARRIVSLAEREISGFTAPRIMDYGCGTGMCGIPLARRASGVLAVDIAPGMLEELRKKAAALNLTNIETLQHDLAAHPLSCGPFDAIITAMAMHHVKDLALLLERFRPLLTPDGVLIVADLDQEDGSFHSDPTGVEHHGFKRDWILNALWDAGFRMVSIETAHVIEKPTATGIGRFPVFFMAARNRPRR